MTETMTCSHCAVLAGKYPALDSRTQLGQPKNTAHARVFVHPHAMRSFTIGILQSTLEAYGYDMNETRIGPPSARGVCELCRLRARAPDGTMTLERMDGVQFTYREGDQAA